MTHLTIKCDELEKERFSNFKIPILTTYCHVCHLWLEQLDQGLLELPALKRCPPARTQKIQLIFFARSTFQLRYTLRSNN